MIDLQVIPVTDAIWCVRRPSYLTCSYVVDTTAGLVLIDAGMDSDGRDMLGALSQIGKDPNSVRAILLTHWHNDHSAGAHVLKEQSGATVCYHEADAPQFTKATAHPGLRGWISDLIPEWGVFVLAKGLLGESAPRAVDADIWAEEGAQVFQDFDVIATPGHTPGHVSFFHRPSRALFAGDALAVIGGQVHFMARVVTPDKDKARESMLRCLALEPDILCPGHREPLTENVAQRCREMTAFIREGGRWPLLG
jgi:glyoxylase-like metal-dependent hydrolase (beta-lactamase superfamily II)